MPNSTERKIKLTDDVCKTLKAPTRGFSYTYDTLEHGLAVRVLHNGTRVFVVRYLNKGRTRYYSIGRVGDWKIKAARIRANDVKAEVRDGKDPLDEAKAETVADLIQRFREECIPKLRPSTAREYEAMLAKDIEPELGKLKASAVSFSDLDKLHRKITKRGSPIRADATLVVVRRLFNMAIKWGVVTSNACKGIEWNGSEPRKRYLSSEELVRLTTALARHNDQQMANLVRLLLLTGARSGEVKGMRWGELDLTQGMWVKPSSRTKTKTQHTAPLSAPARQLLAKMLAAAKAKAKADDKELSEFVFPSDSQSGHIEEYKKTWATLCQKAKISGCRVHDIRHSYASFLASSGVNLATIGALLGHSQISTTSRYTHLFDDAQRAATEKVGALIAAGPSAEVVSFPAKRKPRK